MCEVPVSQNSVLSAEGEQDKDCCHGIRMYSGHRTCSRDIPFLEYSPGTAVFFHEMLISVRNYNNVWNFIAHSVWKFKLSLERLLLCHTLHLLVGRCSVVPLVPMNIGCMHGGDLLS